MTDPRGSSPSGDRRGDAPDEPGKERSSRLDNRTQQEGRLSLSRLFSARGERSLLSSQGLRLSDSNRGAIADQGKPTFDGRRMRDLERILNNSPIERDLSASAKPNIGSTGAAGRDFRLSRTSFQDTASNVGLGIPMGLEQHFRLRGIEIKDEVDREKLRDIKAQIRNIIAQKSEEEDKPSSRALSTEEKHIRQELDSQTEATDIFSNALHLASMYQHLGYIDEAMEAVLLALQIHPNDLLAMQLFKELERVHPQDITFSPVISPVSGLSRTSLSKRIINLSKGKVIVVGDLLIDEILEGNPERISREAPVLILEHVATEHIPGGAANTAHNITALGANCHAVGICGEDDYKDKLAAMLTRHRISHDLVGDPERKTTVKTRILSKSHSLLQQLLRMDRISHEKISQVLAEKLMEHIKHAAGSFDAIILSDYKAGAITDEVIESCKSVAKEHGLKVIVDAQNGFERFSDCTLLTPNQPDTEAAIGYKITDESSLMRAGEDMLKITGAESVLLTRGAEGMVLFRKHDAPVTLPPFNRSEVFDVTGAGDTVVATMTLALVTGASYVEAMALGNLAAGIVVRKPGTAVTSQKEMLDALEKIDLQFKS